MNTFSNDLSVLACSATEIIDRVLGHARRVLLYGPPGVGKSTLAARLGSALALRGHRCWCISADPGSPGFGIPGAVSMGKWQEDGWQVVSIEALCSLDAGRFRLPLVAQVRRLAGQRFNDDVVLLDGPGVVRGVAGSELLQGLAEAGNVDAVLALTAAERPPLLLNELRALVAEVFVVHAATQAKRPGRRQRARRRTEQWQAYLSDAGEQCIDLTKVHLIGTPPPREVTSAWVGRQVALLENNQTLAMAEVLHLDGDLLTIRIADAALSADTLLVRDALRSANGWIETATPFAMGPLEYLPPLDMASSVEDSGGPRAVGRIGAVDVSLVNGVFGDPLLHLRLRHQRRSLLFDLGEGGRLSARIAHQITDVFISHAHMDHIGGFLWLLRSRLGDFPGCRLYGPPGLADHIEGFIQGILWDRVAERGPRFEVLELHGECLRRFQLQPGRIGRQWLDELAVADGVVLDEPGFRVRAVTLDHGTPVLAFAFEPAKQINIRKDRLLARGLAPGKWLGELKQQLLAENFPARIQLPDGSEAGVEELAADLTLITPGKKLVYATDLADTAGNRTHLEALAQHAHTFFCEAPFIDADADQAARTGHLTARACGEIATAAGVARLVPFHFSRRYGDRPERIYQEIISVCNRVMVPKSMALFSTNAESQ